MILARAAPSEPGSNILSGDPGSAAVLAEISLRSPRQVFMFIITKKNTGSKYPKNKLFHFEKHFTGPSSQEQLVPLPLDTYQRMDDEDYVRTVIAPDDVP